MTDNINRQWRLAARPVGLIKESDFSWHEEAVPEISDGQILIRNQYLSLDPTNRIWVTDVPSYLPPVGIGEVMRGLGIGEIVASNHPDFKVGDLAQGLLGWQDYYVGDGKGIQTFAANPMIPGRSRQNHREVFACRLKNLQPELAV